jgi:hypothetical protein
VTSAPSGPRNRCGSEHSREDRLPADASRNALQDRPFPNSDLQQPSGQLVVFWRFTLAERIIALVTC